MRWILRSAIRGDYYANDKYTRFCQIANQTGGNTGDLKYPYPENASAINGDGLVVIISSIKEYAS